MRLPGAFRPADRWHERQLAHALRAVPLFRDLPGDELVSLWRRFVEVPVPAGTVLCRRGEPGDRFYVIRRGVASVSLGLGAGSAFVRQLGPGDCVGEMALLTGEPRSADVVVTEDAIVWQLERPDFEAVATSVPLLRGLIRTLCERLAVTTRALEERQASRASAGTPTGLHFGAYRVIDQIGAGGMAAVFSAVHASSERAAAVKVLPAGWGAAPILKQRLRQEASALQHIRHPNVIRVQEVGEVEAHLGGGCYLAMEWLPNALDRALDAQYPEPFAPATALRIALGVAQGLAAVHDAELLHRDIKPSNILLRDDGTPVLTDFGLATSLREVAFLHHLTPPDHMVGSADYLSPEHIAGEPVDARSDLYSLGVVLHQLLTGAVPFAGATPLEMMQAHLEQPVPPLPVHLPPLARAVVERLLQRHPDDRFSSATAVADALAAALDQARQLDPGAEHRTYLRSTARGHLVPGEPVIWEEPRLEVQWSYDGQRLAVDFALLDVSQGGLGIAAPDPPPVGSPVHVCLRATATPNPVYGDDGADVTVEGRLVYAATMELGIGIPSYRCGIAFDTVAPALAAAILRSSAGSPSLAPAAA